MMQDEKIRNNKYVSAPLFASDQTLSKFPKTEVVIASLDSFKDDNYKLFKRLVESGAKDVHCTLFRMMPHGFLSLHLPLKNGIPESLQCIETVGECMIRMCSDEPYVSIQDIENDQIFMKVKEEEEKQQDFSS